MTVTTNDRAEFARRRNAGLKARHAKRLQRWISVDDFLKAYDAQRDPNGQYGQVGRDPQNILQLKDIA